jgi:hypothetical protein
VKEGKQKGRGKPHPGFILLFKKFIKNPKSAIGNLKFDRETPADGPLLPHLIHVKEWSWTKS